MTSISSELGSSAKPVCQGGGRWMDPARGGWTYLGVTSQLSVRSVSQVICHLSSQSPASRPSDDGVIASPAQTGTGEVL